MMLLRHGRPLLLLPLLLVACGKSGGTPPLAAPGALSYGGSGFDLAPGQAIDPLEPTTVGEGGVWTVAPDLPAGLQLDAATGIISGTPSSSFLRRSLHEVVVENESGTASAWLNFRIGGAARFSYASSGTDGAISELGVGDGSQPLRALGWAGVGGTLANPLGATDLAVDEDGQVLCRVNAFDLACFAIDGATGRLEPLPDPDTTNRVNLSTGPHDLAMRPDGSYVFVTSGDSDRIQAYRITQGSGALSLVDEKTTDPDPLGVACDPQGRYLAVRHDYDDTEGSEGTTLRSYAIVPGTGQLVLPVSVELEGVQLTDLAYGPVGRNLYACGTLPEGRIHHLRVDPVTGELTLQDSLGAGTAPEDLQVSPTGRFVHATDPTGGQVLVFRVDLLDGSLTATGAYTTGGTPEGLAYSFDGSELMVLDPSRQLMETFAVDEATGDLTLLRQRRVRAGTDRLVQVTGSAALLPRAISLVAAGAGSNEVSSYLVDPATGGLDDQGLAPIATIGTPTGVTVDPLARFAFVACRNGPAGQQNTVESFDLDAAGHVQDQGTVSVFPEGTNLGATPGLLRPGPGGRLLYTPLPDTANELLAVLPVNPDGSVLDDKGGAISLPEARGPITDVDISPSMQNLYLTVEAGPTFATGEVQVLQLAATNGRTGESPQFTIEAAGAPSSIVFDPTGSHAYVTLRDSNLVQAFSVELDGSLLPVGPGSTTRDRPVDIVLSEDGLHAYVVCTGADPGVDVGQLLLYDVDPTTRELVDADTGTRTWREEVTAGTPPTRVLLPPGEDFLHVLDEGFSRIVVFDIDAEGVPTFSAVAPVTTDPVGASHTIVLE